MKARAPLFGLLAVMIAAGCAFTSRPMIPGATAESDAGTDDTRNDRDAAAPAVDAAAVFDVSAADVNPGTAFVDQCPTDDDRDAGDGGDVRDVPLYLRDGAPCDPGLRDASVRDGARDGDVALDGGDDGPTAGERDRP